MEKHKKKILGKEKGITLIALVITIIVLLILAGVSIAMLTGENGILTQAQKSSEQTEIAEVKERAKTDILGIQAGNGGKIDKEQFVGVLGIYFDGVPTAEELPDDLTILTLTTKVEYGSHSIKISEIYNGKLEDVEKTVEDLKLGDKVTYIDKNNNEIECVVLYDVSSGYGVQVISKDVVGEDVTFGVDDDFEASKEDYNNALKILYDKAQEYLNPIYASGARCVGSDPVDSDWDVNENEAGYYTKEIAQEAKEYQNWMEDNGWYSIFKNRDEKCNRDWTQMGKIADIKTASKTYWLASRQITAYTYNMYCSVSKVRASGSFADRVC